MPPLLLPCQHKPATAPLCLPAEKLCEEDYAAGILGLNISRAAATLEKAGVQERQESQGADETITWATEV